MVNGKEENINIVIAKAWFYLIEISTITGIIRYASEKYNLLALKIIYWISFYLSYNLITETIKCTDFNFFLKKTKKSNFGLATFLQLFWQQ